MEHIIRYYSDIKVQETPKNETLPGFLREFMNAAFAQTGIYGGIKYSDRFSLEKK